MTSRTRTYSDGVFTSATAWITVAEESPRLLVLSRFTTPTGHEDVIVCLIEVGVSGNERYYETGGNGSIIDGDMNLTTDYEWDRIRSISGLRINLNHTTGRTVDAETLFESGGQFFDGTVHVQDNDGVVSVDMSDIDRDNIGGSGINVIPTVSQDFVDKVNDAVTGDRIIIAFTQPAAVVPHGSFTGDANHARVYLYIAGRQPDCAHRTRCVWQ